MLQLDHLVLVAPTLEAGADHIEQLLGVRPFPGGQHRELGTHNLLLRIGADVFLEVIAINPSATSHQGPRVFGIGDGARVLADWEAGFRLKTWVGRTLDLEPFVRDHSPIVGQIKAVTRGERHWHMAIPPDGSLPMQGAAPTPVVYEPGMIPASHMPDEGIELQQVIVEHPDAERVRLLYSQWGVTGPVVVQSGSRARLRAIIRGKLGEVEIR
ncbi:VOC family protein [Zavarzinella formosa]|uniref:VOC family protein n=1 Tax=Zavarzinella formosa TaxID=360055 RepID=UPI0002FC133C|nr:VOC family protein [Zavarzinella formosa]